MGIFLLAVKEGPRSHWRSELLNRGRVSLYLGVCSAGREAKLSGEDIEGTGEADHRRVFGHAPGRQVAEIKFATLWRSSHIGEFYRRTSEDHPPITPITQIKREGQRAKRKGPNRGCDFIEGGQSVSRGLLIGEEFCLPLALCQLTQKCEKRGEINRLADVGLVAGGKHPFPIFGAGMSC